MHKKRLGSTGNYVYKTEYNRNTIPNLLTGVEVDYYFMATRFGSIKTEILIILWFVMVGSEGFVYAFQTSHIGHFECWKDTIRKRIVNHLH